MGPPVRVQDIELRAVRIGIEGDEQSAFDRRAVLQQRDRITFPPHLERAVRERAAVRQLRPAVLVGAVGHEKEAELRPFGQVAERHRGARGQRPLAVMARGIVAGGAVDVRKDQRGIVEAAVRGDLEHAQRALQPRHLVDERHRHVASRVEGDVGGVDAVDPVGAELDPLDQPGIVDGGLKLESTVELGHEAQGGTGLDDRRRQGGRGFGRDGLARKHGLAPGGRRRRGAEFDIVVAVVGAKSVVQRRELGRVAQRGGPQRTQRLQPRSDVARVVGREAGTTAGEHLVRAVALAGVGVARHRDLGHHHRLGRRAGKVGPRQQLVGGDRAGRPAPRGWADCRDGRRSGRARPRRPGPGSPRGRRRRSRSGWPRDRRSGRAVPPAGRPRRRSMTRSPWMGASSTVGRAAGSTGTAAAVASASMIGADRVAAASLIERLRVAVVRMNVGCLRVNHGEIY